MKICLYTLAFYPRIGGMENFVYLLAREFVKLGHSVTIFTEIKKKSKKKFPFKIIRSDSLLKKIKIFKKHDVVLINNFSLKGIPAGLLSGVKFYIIHHSHYYTGSNKFLWKAYLKVKLTIFFNNIVVSKFVANIIPGYSKIIHNMYDDHIFKKKNIKKTKDFIFCGRLVSDKGVDILINAFSLTLKKFPKCTLSIVGSGPEYSSLKKQVNELNLTNSIKFTGILSGKVLNNKFNEHRCTVVPSRNEAYGIVALEGLATTEFVITSNKGGLPEALNGCGLAVELNCIKLSKAMINFLKKKKTQKRHAQLCKLHLLNQNPKRVAKRYIDHIDNKI